MTTSGTTTYSVTELDIYKDALGNLGMAPPGEEIGGDELLICRRKLNMLVKQWVGQADFAPGLKMWTRRRGYIFLQSDQIEYTMPGDKGAESYVTTTIGAAEASGQTTITLTSATGFVAAMVVGIELDDGSLLWTTVTSVSAPDIVIPAPGLTDTAAAGNRVFAYATAAALRAPFEIEAASLRDTSGTDQYIDVGQTMTDYEAIPTKSADGTPSTIYVEYKNGSAKLFLDAAPDDVTKVIRVVYLSYIEDLTATTETIDFPQEWYRALGNQLAIDLAPTFEKAVSQELKMNRDESLMMARNAHPAKVRMGYEHDPDCY